MPTDTIPNVLDAEALGRIVKQQALEGATSIVVTRNENGTYNVVAIFPDR